MYTLFLNEKHGGGGGAAGAWAVVQLYYMIVLKCLHGDLINGSQGRTRRIQNLCIRIS